MTITKVIAISAFGIILSGCIPHADQMQIEGSTAAVATPAAVEHKHQLPDSNYHTHSHNNGGDVSHSHSLEQIKKEMAPK